MTLLELLIKVEQLLLTIVLFLLSMVVVVDAAAEGSDAVVTALCCCCCCVGRLRWSGVKELTLQLLVDDEEAGAAEPVKQDAPWPIIRTPARDDVKLG